MTLNELFADPGDIADSMVMSQRQDDLSVGVDAVHKGKSSPRLSPRKDSNIEKAKRIKNLAKLKARDTSTDSTDTPHRHHLGGHFSAFLQR
jgi:hypothetical protein